MPVVKVSISVREDLWQQLQLDLAESGEGVSAVLNDALERHLRRRAGLAATREVLDQIGWPTEEDELALDAELADAGLHDLVGKRLR